MCDNEHFIPGSMPGELGISYESSPKFNHKEEQLGVPESGDTNSSKVYIESLNELKEELSDRLRSAQAEQKALKAYLRETEMKIVAERLSLRIFVSKSFEEPID